MPRGRKPKNADVAGFHAAEKLNGTDTVVRRGRKPKAVAPEASADEETEGSAEGVAAAAQPEAAKPIEKARLAVEQIRLDQEDVVKRMAVRTLMGDIRDMVLQKLRFEQDKRPWDQRKESEQRETIAQVEAMAQDLVRRAVEIISSAGLPTIAGKLESVTVKEGIKLTIVMDRSNSQRHSVIDAVGGEILLVSANADIFMGQREPVRVKKDQLDIEDVAVTHSNEQADKIERRQAGASAAQPEADTEDDPDDLFGENLGGSSAHMSPLQ